jgi:hypothetical protein
MRPFSTMARDIPVDAYDDAEDVVTAPTPLDFYCMKQKKELLQQYMRKESTLTAKE